MKNIGILFSALLIFSCASKAPDKEPLATNYTPEDLVSMEGMQLGDLILPDGFKIDVFARVPNARSLALTENGTLFVAN